MADISTINQDDLISDSRGVINDNFSSLNSDLTTHKNNVSNPHAVSKTQVGLGNVDNTSDATKPVSTATQTALDLKADITDLDAKINDVDIKRIYKSADETVNNSDVLQNDDHLTFAIGANEVWAINLTLMYRSASTPDLKYALSIPSGATYQLFSVQQFQAIGDGAAITVAVAGGSGASTTEGEFASGVVTCGATPGNVTLQWAQNTTNVSDTKVLKGSYIIAHRLA